MEKMIYILKIIYYLFFVYLMYEIGKKYYKKIEENKESKIKKRIKISIIAILLLCSIYGIYSIICGQTPEAGDRYNFAFRFENKGYSSFVKNESIGLFWLENILHFFTWDSRALFFICAFLHLFLTLIAYKISDKAEPLVLLAMGMSSYLVLGFYMFKQSIAISLIAIAFALLEKNKKFTALIATFFAICFHESAWIVIPLYFAMFCSKNKIIRSLEYLILVICLLFFNNLNQIIIGVVTKIIPGMSGQLDHYLNENGQIIRNFNFMTILKGIPFYFITVFGFVKRKNLKEKIDNYDKYMICSFFTSIATIASMFMYWMYRFALYCYFPVFIFASLIHKELKENERIIFSFCFYIISFLLTLRLLFQYYFLYGGI